MHQQDTAPFEFSAILLGGVAPIIGQHIRQGPQTRPKAHLRYGWYVEHIRANDCFDHHRHRWFAVRIRQMRSIQEIA